MIHQNISGWGIDDVCEEFSGTLHEKLGEDLPWRERFAIVKDQKFSTLDNQQVYVFFDYV